MTYTHDMSNRANVGEIEALPWKEPLQVEASNVAKQSFIDAAYKV